MPTARNAHVIADQTILATLPAAAFKVRSWDNAHSPATQKTVTELCQARGWVDERVFDAAHGRRYVLFIYPAASLTSGGHARRNCFETLAAS